MVLPQLETPTVVYLLPTLSLTVITTTVPTTQYATVDRHKPKSQLYLMISPRDAFQRASTKSTASALTTQQQRLSPAPVQQDSPKSFQSQQKTTPTQLLMPVPTHWFPTVRPTRLTRLLVPRLLPFGPALTMVTTSSVKLVRSVLMPTQEPLILFQHQGIL